MRLLGIGTRRSEVRAEASRLATLSTEGHDMPVTMVNLSPNGVAILTNSAPDSEKRHTLTYFVGELKCTAELQVVRWSKCEHGYEWGCRRKLLREEEIEFPATHPQELMTDTSQQESTALSFSEDKKDPWNLSHVVGLGSPVGSYPSGETDEAGSAPRAPIVALECETDAAPAVTQSATSDPLIGAQASEADLRLQLAEVQAAKTAKEQSLPALKQAEFEALEKHDKAALDSVWSEHDVRLQELERLQSRREELRQRLVDLAEAALDRWRKSAEDRVCAWRHDGEIVVHDMLQGLDEIEVLLTRLQAAPRRQTEERQALLAELDVLRERDWPVDLPHPEIDWHVPFADLRDVTERLERILSTSRTVFAE